MGIGGLQSTTIKLTFFVIVSLSSHNTIHTFRGCSLAKTEIRFYTQTLLISFRAAHCAQHGYLARKPAEQICTLKYKLYWSFTKVLQEHSKMEKNNEDVFPLFGQFDTNMFKPGPHTSHLLPASTYLQSKSNRNFEKSPYSWTKRCLLCLYIHLLAGVLNFAFNQQSGAAESRGSRNRSEFCSWFLPRFDR